MTQLIQDYPTNIGPNVTYGDFVRNLFRPLDPAAMLAHAAMGVVTEIQELIDATTAANAVEEAGDIAFFCAAFIQSLPISLFSKEEADTAQREVFLQYCLKHSAQPTADLGGDDVAELIFELSIEMLDAAKRWLAYDKAPTEETCQRLVGCAELIAGLALEVIEMLGAAKRWLAYDKAPTEETCQRLVGCAELIAGLALEVTDNPAETFGPQSVIDVNVAKLQHRYKAGFSVEAAVNRDVASELEVIQSAART